MNEGVLERLRRQGAVVSLPEGEAVLVSLHLTNVPPLPRKERKHHLADAFASLRAPLAQAGVALDMESISVSAQTADAVIPAARYDEIVSKLRREGIRTDPLVDRQVLASGP